MSEIRKMMIGIFVIGIFLNLIGFIYVSMTLKSSKLKGLKGVDGPKGPSGSRGETGDPGPIAASPGEKGAIGKMGRIGFPCWEENTIVRTGDGQEVQCKEYLDSMSSPST
jgi:hypothetical protein